MLCTDNIIHFLMKAFASIFATCITAAALPVSAGPFTSTITDTAVISVQGAGIQMTRVGSEYKASGVGITSTATGGAITSGAATTTFTPTDPTGTFQFSESYRAADTKDQAVTISATGEIGTTNLYGEATIQYAGTAGTGTSITMPLVQSTTGPTTVTSTVGGPVITVADGASGVTATAQRSISLTVFD